jgi:uncharacterized membrane protein
MIALVASAALNLLVLGAVGSAYLQSPRDDWPMRRGLSRSAISFVETLPAARQQEVGPVIAQARSKMRPLRRLVGDGRREVGKLLLAEPFNKAAYDAEAAKLLEAEGNMRRHVNVALGEIMARLSAAERKQLYDYHQKRRRGHWRRTPDKPPAGTADPGKSAP